MRKLIILLMLIMGAGAVMAQISSYGLRVTLINQDPDPAQPGQYVDLRFKVENIATSEIDSAEVELLPQFPFSMDANEVAERSLGSLSNSLVGDAATTVKYRIRIADNAIQGSNPIKIRMRSGTDDWITREFQVNVRISDTTLSIESVSTGKEVFSPGDSGTIELSLKNSAGTSFRDISLRLDLTLSGMAQATGTTSASLLTAIPIAPKNSATEKRINVILPDEEKMLAFDISIYPSAEPGVYKIPVLLSFYDEMGTLYNKIDIIGVTIGAMPSLEVNLEEYTLKKEGDEGTVSVKFVNKGITDIKFLSTVLKESAQYEILSSEKYYIGNLDSDDYEIAEFRIKLKNGVSGEIGLPVQYSYKDPLNREYNYDTEVGFKVYSKAEAVAQGIDVKPNVVMIIVSAVVGIIGLFVLVIGLYIVWRLTWKALKRFIP